MRMTNRIKLVVLSVLIAGLSACATAEQSQAQAQIQKSALANYQGKAFIRDNYKAADSLSASANERQNISTNTPILVATLVNIDNLTESSRMGRMISEQLQARFAQQGYSVIELKLRGDLFVKKDAGELLLSREIKDIVTNHKAQAVVVGTYAVAVNNVFINLKMVGNDNIILGSYDYSIDIDPDTKALLTKK